MHDPTVSFQYLCIFSLKSWNFHILLSFWSNNKIYKFLETENGKILKICIQTKKCKSVQISGLKCIVKSKVFLNFLKTKRVFFRK